MLLGRAGQPLILALLSGIHSAPVDDGMGGKMSQEDSVVFEQPPHSSTGCRDPQHVYAAKTHEDQNCSILGCIKWRYRYYINACKLFVPGKYEDKSGKKRFAGSAQMKESGFPGRNSRRLDMLQ